MIPFKLPGLSFFVIQGAIFFLFGFGIGFGLGWFMS
jgi:hypothetical protein